MASRQALPKGMCGDMPRRDAALAPGANWRLEYDDEDLTKRRILTLASPKNTSDCICGYAATRPTIRLIFFNWRYSLLNKNQSFSDSSARTEQ